MTPMQLAEDAARILIEKKARDVRIFDVHEHSSVTDVYVNVTARSASHVLALAEDLADKLEELYGRSPLRIEGRSERSWILVDYGELIVNVFDQASRDFYKFDRLFPEEASVDVTPLIEEIDRKFDINAKEIKA